MPSTLRWTCGWTPPPTGPPPRPCCRSCPRRAPPPTSRASAAPLDMRPDPPSDGPTAADLLRELPEAELARILRDLGDERFAKRIARRLVAQRQQAPLTRSGELVELLEQSIPAASRASG